MCVMGEWDGGERTWGIITDHIGKDKTAPKLTYSIFELSPHFIIANHKKKGQLKNYVKLIRSTLKLSPLLIYNVPGSLSPTITIQNTQTTCPGPGLARYQCFTCIKEHHYNSFGYNYCI